MKNRRARAWYIYSVRNHTGAESYSFEKCMIQEDSVRRTPWEA